MGSAGVYPQEIDLSLYASNETDTVYGLVGTFSKGEIDPSAPVLVTSYPELLSVFGKPRPDGNSQAWYACREYLRRGNKLKVVRVDSTANPAVAATSSLRGYLESAVYAGSAIGATVNPNVLNDATPATFQTGNVEPGDIVEITVGADAGFYEVDTVPLETQITVKGVTAWPSAGAAGQTYQIISGKRQSLADGATSVAATRTFTSATGRFTAGADNCQVQAGDILVIIDVGTTGDNGAYVVSSVTNATTLVVNRDFPTGSLAALTYEIYTYVARQEIGATSVPATRTLTCAGHDFTAHGVVAGDILVVQDTDAATTGDNGVYTISVVAATVLTINQDWPVGSLAALTFWVLPASIRLTAFSEGLNGDDLESFVTAYAGEEATKFNLEVREGGVQVEKWFGLTYAGIVAEIADSTYAVPIVIAARGNVPPDHDVDFAGGDDGLVGIVDGDYIGTPATGLGLYGSAEAEEVHVSSVPGITTQPVGDALVNMGEARKNCVVLPDPPVWATISHPTEAIQWHNGLGAFGRTLAISSSYAAVYWPEVQVYDEYNSTYRWTAPSGHVAAAFAYNDNVKFPWWAPAGGDRGRLIGATGLRMTPDQGQRDSMQSGTNCLNPIVQFANEGVMLYGQKTCLRTTTALNRLNVRRMIMWITKNGSSSLRNLVFDPNDESTWKLVVDILDPLLRFVKRNRGMSDYLIVCDANNNTALTKANYQLIVDIYVKPTPTAEEIHLRFVLTSQDANFQELTGA